MIPGTITSTVPSLRVGIQGPPGSGKTTAACTFPNPVIGSSDHKEPAGVSVLPFYDHEFMWRILKPKESKYPSTPPNKRDALLMWYRQNVASLPKDITFIHDSWTTTMDWFISQGGEYGIDPGPYQDKGGEYRIMWFYGHMLEYCSELMSLLTSAPCNVIVTFHEQIERDDNGNPTGRYKPLVSGQFADRVAARFTMYLRQVILPYGKLSAADTACYIDYCKEKGKSTPKSDDPCYLWQIGSDDKFYAILPPGFKRGPKYIAADYSELLKRL